MPPSPRSDCSSYGPSFSPAESGIKIQSVYRSNYSIWLPGVRTGCIVSRPEIGFSRRGLNGYSLVAKTALKQGVREDDNVSFRIGEEASGGGLYAGYGRDLGHHRLLAGMAEGDRRIVEFIFIWIR
jgi:hypothetical protein